LGCYTIVVNNTSQQKRKKYVRRCRCHQPPHCSCRQCTTTRAALSASTATPHVHVASYDVCNAVHTCTARLRYSALATAHGTTEEVAIRRPRHHACHARAEVSALQRQEARAHLQLAVIELRVGRGIAEDKKPAFLREARLNYAIHLPRRDQCLQSMEVHRAELVTHLTGAARSFLRRRAMECEHCL
jgi:hypothetical protein